MKTTFALPLLLTFASACSSHVSLVRDNHTPTPEECRQYTDLRLWPQAPTAFPVEVLVDISMSNHNIGLILDALDAWNDRLEQEIFYLTITADVIGMHERCNYVTISTSVLLPGDWIGFTTANRCAADHIDVESAELHLTDGTAGFFTDQVVTAIATHELGHVLGLMHEQDPTSILFPTLGYGQSISQRSVCLVWLAISRASQAQEDQDELPQPPQ